MDIRNHLQHLSEAASLIAEANDKLEFLAKEREEGKVLLEDYSEHDVVFLVLISTAQKYIEVEITNALFDAMKLLGDELKNERGRTTLQKL